jgi:diacylglycerol kinase (ATP)
LESCRTDQIPRQIKVIFNPAAGVAEESPGQLMEVISQLQSGGHSPEVYMVGPDCDLSLVVQDALKRGIHMFVVCGGDGTVESVAGALVNTTATLGIVPTGTRNNVALSLGIPEDISAAARLLHQNKPVKIDVGEVVCCGNSRIFLETCSIGLLSALFPAADEIQHGNLASIGDFLTTLIASPSAKVHLVMDNQQQITTNAHAVLIANLPYVGPHYPIVPKGSFDDGLLDVLVFSDLTKLDLLSNAIQIAAGGTEDPRIQRYHAKKIEMDTQPLMPVFADGFSLGEGPLSISVRRCALTVISGRAINAEKKDLNDIAAAPVNSDVMIER